MKYTFLIIFSLLLTSCYNQKKITEFERILGKTESKTLTYLVKDFEKKYLKQHYPNLTTNDAFKKFITDVNTTGKILNPEEVSNESFEKFKKSKLRLQIYSIPDSIWIERNTNNTGIKKNNATLMIKWKSLKEDGTYEYRTSESNPNYLKSTDEDEIIRMSEKRKEINYFGSYNKAVNAIFSKPSFISEYFEYRDNSGNSNPSIYIPRLLNSNSDFNDYFIKRITVIELVY